MHATSKLIIPAKSAQDSPYVPKIRIFLRPSSSLDKSTDMGSSLGPNSLMTDVSHHNHSEESQVEQATKTQDSDPSSSSIEPNQDDMPIKPHQEQVRSGRKRKLGGSLDNIDFERRDSLLTKVNLKKIINMETFESLPLESRRNLLTLLPIHDRHPPPDVPIPTEGTDCWIHPTALSNEFFTKALQDYSTRQMNGDFSPRLNSRTGLRKSVGNRQRYSSPTASPISAPSHSTPKFQSPAVSAKEDPPVQTPLNLTNGSVKTNGVNFPTARFRSRPSVLQTALTKEEPMDSKSEMASEESQETIAAKLGAKGCESEPQSVFSQFVPAAPSFTTTSSANSTSSDSSNISSSPSHGRSFSNPSSSGLSPSASAPTTKSSKTEEVDRPASRPCAGFSEPSSQRRLNMPKLESTLLLQSSAKPPQDSPANCPRRASVAALGRRPSQMGSDLPSSSRPPLVVDSSTPSTVHTPTAAMPPPRETKTLANVRESFRAQRLRMLKQQQSNSIQTSSVSKGQQDQPQTCAGSLTPNPGTTHSNDFCGSSPISNAPNVVQPTVTVASTLTPVMIQPSAVLIQPTGSSVSAPPTPQHGSTGTGVAGVPLPAILANFKEARVVVTPSRSGSSASSNDGGPEVSDQVDQDGQLLHQAAHQQPVSQKQPLPQQQQHQQPIVAVAAGGPATTTRAYFVDGNNLTETLALLQSINPRATVTQQQFLLIPSTDKSHAILCRTPIAIQPKQTSSTPSQSQTVQQILRKPSGSTPVASVCSSVTSATPAPAVVRPLILPVSRSQEQPQQQPQVTTIPQGLYREILPNMNNGSSNVQRFQPAPIQPHQQQQQSQLRPASAYFGLLASSNITGNVNPITSANINAATTAPGNSGNTTNSNNSGSSSNNNNNPPTSFLPPPPS
ncbi:hypothetical protein Aperf_G00000013760 [Anoplocephala perfoliata]